MTDTHQQQTMIREAMKAIAERRPGRTKLIYDKTKRTIVAVAENSATPRALNITADDADMFAVMTISADWLTERWASIERGEPVHARLSDWDDGDAFTQIELGVQGSSQIVDCFVALGDAPESGTGRLSIILTRVEPTPSDKSIFIAPDNSHYRLEAFIRQASKNEPVDVVVTYVQPELSLRRDGLLETNVLADRSVLCIGLGTGGAHVAVELAKCGVGRFALVDSDRLSVGNVVRHPGPLSQTGRYKVKVVRDLILEKNPDARISVHPCDVSENNADSILALIRESDVIVCGTDNRASKLLINRLALDAGVVALYGGAFRRAYGGQVLRVRPGRSLCHQCFIGAMPDAAADVEISSAEAAAAVAYSDRPVAIEPGLSLDVLPIATFLAKLALNELVVGKASSLSVLERDYDAPLYLWVNRPEAGTPYANFPPLSESMDEMTINRWYGVYFDRDTACPACGDFVGATAKAYGFALDSVQLPSAPAGREELAATC